MTAYNQNDSSSTMYTSRQSVKSFNSNMSLINKQNYSRFGRSKITFLIINSLVLILLIKVYNYCNNNNFIFNFYMGKWLFGCTISKVIKRRFINCIYCYFYWNGFDWVSWFSRCIYTPKRNYCIVLSLCMASIGRVDCSWLHFI